MGGRSGEEHAGSGDQRQAAATGAGSSGRPRRGSRAGDPAGRQAAAAPTPARLRIAAVDHRGTTGSDGQLKAAGFSRAKMVYGRDLAAGILGGRLDVEALAAMSDDEAVARLTA